LFNTCFYYTATAEKVKKNPGGCDDTGVSAKEFGKKRGRKEDLRSSKGAAHGFRNLSVIRILSGFERPITET